MCGDVELEWENYFRKGEREKRRKVMKSNEVGGGNWMEKFNRMEGGDKEVR